MLCSVMGTPQQFDVAKLERDIAARGWLARDLARAAGVSDMTVSRVLSSERSNPRTWARIAAAMGYTVRRYLLAKQEVA